MRVLACPAMRLAGVYALVAAIVAVVFAIAILTGPFRAVERSDYMTYHVAARIVLAGDGDCLYRVECQAAAQRELIGDEPTFERGALPYNSPPWLAAIAAPLGLLSLHVAFVIFTLLGLIVLTLGAWRLTPVGASRLLAPLLVLTAWPTVMGAIRGQLTLPVVGLLGLSVAASRFGSGAFMGFAFLKPTLVPLWVLWQVLGGHWRAVGSAAAVVVVLVALSAVVVSPEAVLAYPAHLVGVTEAGALGVHTEEMVNWRGAAERLGANGWLVVAGSLATIALVGAVWLKTSSRALGAAAAFIATPLVIPHANQHEAILAILGVLVAVTAIRSQTARLGAAALATHIVLWSGPALDAEASAWLVFGAQLAWLVIVVWVAQRYGGDPLSAGN
jgi:alpha-1,2-mannosyltransferase